MTSLERFLTPFGRPRAFSVGEFVDVDEVIGRDVTVDVTCSVVVGVFGGVVVGVFGGVVVVVVVVCMRFFFFVCVYAKQTFIWDD